MDMNELEMRAATDEQFRAALIADPRRVLAAEGLPLPDGVSVRIVESTATDLVLALPPEMEEGELSEQEIADISGAGAGLGLAAVSYAIFKLKEEHALAAGRSGSAAG